MKPALLLAATTWIATGAAVLAAPVQSEVEFGFVISNPEGFGGFQLDGLSDGVVDARIAYSTTTSTLYGRGTTTRDPSNPDLDPTGITFGQVGFFGFRNAATNWLDYELDMAIHGENFGGLGDGSRFRSQTHLELGFRGYFDPSPQATFSLSLPLVGRTSDTVDTTFTGSFYLGDADSEYFLVSFLYWVEILQVPLPGTLSLLAGALGVVGASGMRRKGAARPAMARGE